MLAESWLSSRDVPPEAFPCGNRKFLSLTICWKSIHPIRALYGFSCITCHLLMVAPHCLDGSYSRHSSECLCWLGLILYLQKVFHFALVVIISIIFLVSSIFDYHKEKSPPILRLHCVCGGRPYGSFIFQKASRI